MSINNKPYVIPVNYAYINGRIIFHCAMTGQKINFIRVNPEVCFTVGHQFGKIVPHPQGAVCHSDSDSVICIGHARIIEDIEERRAILNDFNHCLQPKASNIKIEDVANCLAIEIRINKMTSREERDNKCIYRVHDFDKQS